jgi:hypothetical protein
MNVKKGDWMLVKINKDGGIRKKFEKVAEGPFVVEEVTPNSVEFRNARTGKLESVSKRFIRRLRRCPKDGGWKSNCEFSE